MHGDIYQPDLWSGFFTMVGGGVAALTGLVFVALSLNLEEMSREATHKYRSINTLAGLTAIFARCGLVLMAGQNHVAVGAELLVVALLGAVSFLYGFRQAFKFGSHPSLRRMLLGTLLYVVELTGAGFLIGGFISGLYVAAVAIVANVAFLISAAWLLVVGVYTDRASTVPTEGHPTARS